MVMVWAPSTWSASAWAPRRRNRSSLPRGRPSSRTRVSWSSTGRRRPPRSRAPIRAPGRGPRSPSTPLRARCLVQSLRFVEDTNQSRTARPPCYHEYYCSIRSLDTAQFPILAKTVRQQRRDIYVYTYHRLVARGQNHTSQVEDTHRSLAPQPTFDCTRTARAPPRSRPGISCILGRSVLSLRGGLL